MDLNWGTMALVQSGGNASLFAAGSQERTKVPITLNLHRFLNQGSFGGKGPIVYWVWKANVHSAVQMEKWDGNILKMPLSGNWARNSRVSWGCDQDVILYPATMEMARYLY